MHQSTFGAKIRPYAFWCIYSGMGIGKIFQFIFINGFFFSFLRLTAAAGNVAQPL